MPFFNIGYANARPSAGIASALIEESKAIAAARDADVICVQADRGDEAAIAPYSTLGTREDVLHFDIAGFASGHKNTRDRCRPRAFPPPDISS